MILADLQHIFKTQIDLIAPDAKLWFMLVDGDHVVIERHPKDDLPGLLAMLASFEYAGSRGNMPRFVK